MKKLLTLAVLLALTYAALAFIARDTPAPPVTIPADATSVLSDLRFQPPTGWQWSQLDMPGAGTVRFGYASPANPRGLVVFLPGYSAPLNIYFESLTALNAAGYATGGLDWPSQGGSSRPAANAHKIHATSLDPHVAAGRAVQAQLSERYPDVPVFIVGLSMGAQIGTRMLSQSDSAGVTAAALITPAYGIHNGRPTPVETGLLATLSALGFGERYTPGTTDWVYSMQVHNLEASDCSHPNARTRLWQSWMVEDPALKVGGMTIDFARAMIRSARIASSDTTLAMVRVPVWMPTAENDTFVDNAKAAAACERLQTCRAQLYEQARHCLFEESDAFYQPFMADLIAFLDAHNGTPR